MVQAILSALVAAAAVQDGAVGYELVNPRAIELLEREPTLMHWALARFDSNGDGHIGIFEADQAAQEFKRLADSDRDGRVTPSEFRSARDFIAARWRVETAGSNSR